MNSLALWSTGGGLVIGLVFGVVMQRSRFCLVAAVSNLILIRDFRHTQAFLAAWAIAIVGTALLESQGYVLVGDSAYRVARIDWLGAIIGGVVFGFGAALAGGCATRTVVNAAEGHIGGLIALVTMLVFAGMNQYGALEPVRLTLADLTAFAPGTGDSGVAALLGVPPWVAGVAVGLTCLVLMRVLGAVSENRTLIMAGSTIGLLVVLAWFLTGWIAQDAFDPTPPTSAKITGPLARMHYFLATGTGWAFNFSIAFVLGVLAGAFLSAITTGAFRWILPDSARVPHHLVGGALMGTGAIVAGGCNIGQGLSGVSTLSVTSILAAASIFGGVALGVKWWERHI